MPLVSVVIATFNRPASLERAVASALRQTMPDLEVVIVVERDDPPTMIALEGIADRRVRHVVNAEKKGAGVARDTGVAASAGLWIAFLDDDDEWLTNKLERQIAVGADSADIISMTLSCVVTSHGAFVRPIRPYEGLEAVDEWLFDRRSWFKGRDSMLQTSSLMVPRRLFDRIRFGEHQHEEWELVIRAVKQLGFRLVTVPEVLVRFHAGRTYPWRKSLAWIETMRDVVTPRAYSGFCLTVVTQGLASRGRGHAFLTLCRAGIRYGRPTARQLFAFVLIYLMPQGVREQIRSAFGSARQSDTSSNDPRGRSDETAIPATD